MTAKGHETSPAPQPAHVHAAPRPHAEASKPNAQTAGDAPHDEHAHEEPGYGHGV